MIIGVIAGTEKGHEHGVNIIRTEDSEAEDIDLALDNDM